MSRKDVIIAGYMMNEKHVIAEMLYDTITKYENILSSMAATVEANQAALDAYEKKLKENGLFQKKYVHDCGKIYQAWTPAEIELPLRTTGVNEMMQPTSKN